MSELFASPMKLARSVIEHRALIWRLAQREVLSKYRGSLFGIGWSLLLPLFMLAVYTFVFTEVFQARWGLQVQNKGVFALAIFSGLIFYSCFAECALKAPGLMLANTSFITKVVFPLELLPVISTLATTFNAVTSLCVLALGVWVIKGAVPVTFFCAFLMLVPLAIINMGVTWVLSATGVYIRDVGLIVAPLTTAMLFLIPVLYPLEQVPERWRELVELNPLTYIIESSRNAVLMGYMPEWSRYLYLTLGASVFSMLCLVAFNKARRGFADVV